MSDRLKKLRKLSIAISYAALLSASTAFAADSETLKAQEEQFDIFDVDTDQLDELSGSVNKSDKSTKNSESSLSEKDFEENFGIEDDLFVDAVDESGDIEKQSSNTNKPEQKETKTDKEEVSAQNTENENKEIKVDDEDYVFNSREEESLKIPEEEEFKKLLMGEEGEDTNGTSEGVSNAVSEDESDNDNSFVDENNSIDSLFSDFDGNEDSGNDDSDRKDSDMEMQFEADEGYNEISSDDVSDEDTPKAEVNNAISNEVQSEYSKLKRHLNNFLLSFAGENESSVSKASGIHNPGNLIDEENDFYGTDDSSESIEDEIVAFNPAQMFEEEDTANIDNGIVDENTPDGDIEDIGAIDDELENFEELFDTDGSDIEKAAAEDAKKLAEAKRIEEEKLKKEQEEKKRQEQQKIILGSCNGLADKIANCESFECEMPNPAGGDEAIKVSIVKSGDNCSYKTAMSGNKGIDCTLSSGDTSILSTLTTNYFDAAGKENFDVKNEFPTQCSSKKIATAAKPVAKEPTEAKRPVSPQPKKLELSTEDKAYFEMLDEKRKALPKDKQLPDSVIETIREVAPSIAEEKKEVPILSKNVSISRSSGATDAYEDEDVIRSNSGMEISLSKNAGLESEKILKMEKAYHALLAGQTSAAVVLYNQVLELDGDNMDALFGLATAYHKNYQYEQARATYAKILRIEPNNKEVLNNFLVLVSDESPESALLELQKLERINSNFSPIPAQIAMIYLKLGQPETAERYLRRAVVLSPDNITYKYNLAITSDKLNKHYQAISLYKQVLEAAKGGAVIPGSVNAIASRMDYLQGKLSSIN
ncbi:MAG: tetratricopeptide repeat protein [Rickettsiales bacterium]|nr:tetratricopeptide repeat protein [Pseudomonadota bacterium]MDA0967191.1 tetratricopeptide repeat protein [Pseudomonadota bacterium]MDG4544149.1 tetratricopeptide repeat protein [Rickettsiales bacterium]MDG4546330.1 tetratricopeptide repeat protein [Rickettsiales bacterium]MDG4548473.1 tetratricopeptide repeat protein [Rickettsiales bacterium]